MKYFCFVMCTEGGRTIKAMPYSYFTVLDGIPEPFFTLEDISRHSGLSSYLSETNKRKMERAKVGTKIRICKLSRGFAQYIIVLDENSDLFQAYMDNEDLADEIKSLRTQLKENPIYKELQQKKNEKNKANKKIKDLMDSGGV